MITHKRLFTVKHKKILMQLEARHASWYRSVSSISSTLKCPEPVMLKIRMPNGPYKESVIWPQVKEVFLLPLRQKVRKPKVILSRYRQWILCKMLEASTLIFDGMIDSLLFQQYFNVTNCSVIFLIV